MKNIKKNNKIYVRLDADNIGERIELFLIEGDIGKAFLVHKNVQHCMILLKKKIREERNCKVLMFGCDDILLEFPFDKFKMIFIKNLCKLFYRETGFTLSVGVSGTLQEALLNLRRAKLTGKNKIVCSNID